MKETPVRGVTKIFLGLFRRFAAVDTGALARAGILSVVLAGCSAAVPDAEKALSKASEKPDGIYGISPTTLQIRVSAKANYSNINTYYSLAGTLTPLTTNFNTGYVSPVIANRSYSIKAYGVNPSGVESTSPLGEYQIRTWDTFDHSSWSVVKTTEDNNDGTSIQVSWAYRPWSTLPAGDGAREGAFMRCYFAADNGLGTTDPFVSSVRADALVYEGALNVSARDLGLSGVVRIGCETTFLDGTTSRHPSTYTISLKPAIGVCPQSSVTVYDQNYSCGVSDVTTGLPPGYSLKLASGNTCSFLSDTSGTLTGTATDANVGTCSLRYKLVSADGESDTVTRSVTVVNRKALFVQFPSAAYIIDEISRNDPNVPQASGEPNMALLEANASYEETNENQDNGRYVAHVLDTAIQTDKESFGSAAGQSFGSFRTDNSTSTNCARAGEVYHKISGVKTAGVNPRTGEFYFRPKEYFFTTECTVDIYFDDGHGGTESRTNTQAVKIKVVGWNDKPVLTGPVPNNSTYSCGSKCFEGIDYDLSLQAHTGGKNPADLTNTGEPEQQIVLKSGNCVSTHPQYLQVNYCQLDPVSGNITVSFLPLLTPPTGTNVEVRVRASDNGITTMSSATHPAVSGSNANCLGGTYPPSAGFACSNYLNSFQDSEDFIVKIEIDKFNLPIRPALIVSKAACIACHANVEGDIVTDMGNTPPGATRAIAELGGVPRFYNNFFKPDPTPGLAGDRGWTDNRGIHYAGFRSLNQLTGTFYTKKSFLTTAENPTWMSRMGYLNNENGQYYGRPWEPAGMTTPVKLVNFLRSTDYRLDSNDHTDGYVLAKTTFVSVCPGGVTDNANSPKVCTTPPITDVLPSGHDINYLTISAPIPSDIQKIAQASTGPAGQINWLNAEPDVQPLYRIPTEVSVEPRPFSGLDVVGFQPPATVFPGQTPAAVPKYVTNFNKTTGAKQDIYCYGDVVVKGNLFLDAPVFHTDTRGCNIHVSGDVIFHGYNSTTNPSVAADGITVISPNDDTGVQITSAKSISFGLAQNQLVSNLRQLPQSAQAFGASLKVPTGNECFYNGSGGSVINTSGVCPAGYRSFNGIATDGNGNALLNSDGVVYTQNWSDAQVFPSGLRGWNFGNIKYSKLMVNAPVIQSRYLGDFKGSIISDYALFRLGNLKFIFDDVFLGRVPFPRLQTITSATGKPRVIFNAGRCTGSPTDSWECDPNAAQ